jgi:superfamily II DNA helicase RecQ
VHLKVFHIRLTKEHLQADQDRINGFMETVAVKKTATELVQGQPNFWSILVFYEEAKAAQPKVISDKLSVTDENELTDEEKVIYEALKIWRQDKATQLNVPAFMVCRNAELITIAKVKPETLADLEAIKGFAEQKTTKFGDDIIALLNSM